MTLQVQDPTGRKTWHSGAVHEAPLEDHGGRDGAAARVPRPHGQVLECGGSRAFLDRFAGNVAEAVDCDLPLDEVYLKVLVEPMAAGQS